MIIEYYDEYNNTMSYTFLSRGPVEKFDKYLVDHNVPLEKVWETIDDFTETLSLKSKTRRNYNTRMRRFVEYIYYKEGIEW